MKTFVSVLIFLFIVFVGTVAWVWHVVNFPYFARHWFFTFLMRVFTMWGFAYPAWIVMCDNIKKR